MKLDRKKHSPDEARDGNRKFQVPVTGDPFTKEELQQYIIRPLAECRHMLEFLELADWCADGPVQLLNALYIACRANSLTGYIEYLEEVYDCSSCP